MNEAERNAKLLDTRAKLASLLDTLQTSKAAFQAMPPMPQPGGAPPMDPAMMGGAPPPPGGAPPMDPAAMGGAPPPMDPAAAGGAPPPPPPDDFAQIVEGMDAMSQQIQQLGQQQEQIMQALSQGNDPQQPM